MRNWKNKDDLKYCWRKSVFVVMVKVGTQMAGGVVVR